MYGLHFWLCMGVCNSATKGPKSVFKIYMVVRLKPFRRKTQYLSKKIDTIFCRRHFYDYIERKMALLLFFTSSCFICALGSMQFFASVLYLCFWPLNCLLELLANQWWNNEQVHPFEQSSYRVHHPLPPQL
jgi:hypothetical protein